MKQKYKLKSKKAFGLLLMLFIACYFVRQLPIPFISAHIMNFALTGGMLVVSTYPDLVGNGFTKLSLLSVAAFWAAVNIVIEFFVKVDVVRLPGVSFTNFNTSDPIDAVFGLLGVGLFLLVTYKQAIAKT